jgi:hypothetical protein
MKTGTVVAVIQFWTGFAIRFAQKFGKAREILSKCIKIGRRVDTVMQRPKFVA